MRFLIDECLHESLVAVAHDAGFEAIHVNHLGLSGKPDWALADRIVEDEFSFVTIIVPNAVPTIQRAMFEAAILYLAGKELINAAIEVSLDGKSVKCVEYRIPTG
jgi:hypothetical protein